ncbi:Hok/Gef family protein [Enterobacter sp. Lyrl_3]
MIIALTIIILTLVTRKTLCAVFETARLK